MRNLLNIAELEGQTRVTAEDFVMPLRGFDSRRLHPPYPLVSKRFDADGSKGV